MKQQARYTRLILVPTAQTRWSGGDRIQGNLDLPLSDEGLQQARTWADELDSLRIDALYSPKTGPAAETAKVITKALRIKPRVSADLAEVNLGLWQGMHTDELQKKSVKVYRQWLERPDQVSPPEGESLPDARKRIEKAIGKTLDANRAGCVAVVLGNLAMNLARLAREDKPVTELWTLMKDPLTWHEYLIQYRNVDK